MTKASLYGVKDLDKEYEEGDINVSVLELQTKPVLIRNYLKKRDERSNIPWVYTALICFQGSDNNPWYMESDRTPLIAQEFYGRQFTVKFQSRLFPENLWTLINEM